MSCSTGMTYTTGLLLIVNWLLEGRWQEKWQMAKASKLLHAFWVLSLMYVVGLLWTDNLTEGMETVRSMVPLWVAPTIILTSRPVRGITRTIILGCFVIAVMVVTIIGFVRWLTIPDLPYRDIIPYISHIRFSLICCMAIFIVCSKHSMLTNGRFRTLFVIVRVAFAVWLLFFLLLLRSYTGFVVLAVASLVICLYYRRWKWLALWLTGTALCALMVWLGCHSYYDLVPMATEPLKEYTEAGRPYYHAQDGFVENGNYVNNYICREELRAGWARRSSVSLDNVSPSGFALEKSLIRYLNALGLPKDSVGVAALTDDQVDEIAQGVANPVYRHGFMPKRMLYVMLFEYESYRCYHAVEGFTMLQRIALWECAWKVFLSQPLIGTGTGDLQDEMHRVFVDEDSPLQEYNKHPHNQYLTLLAMFGVLGFAIVAFFFLRALRKPSSPLMLAWLTMILLSFLTENTLDTLAGIMVCTWFLPFRGMPKTNTKD